jgi:hypothetical protein
MNDEQQSPESEAPETPQIVKKRRQRVISIAVIVFIIAGAAVYVMRNHRADIPPGTNVCAMINMGTATPRFASKFVEEPETGRQFVSNNVIVGFSEGVPLEDICRLIHEQDGRVVQRFTNVPLFLIEIPDEGDGEVARRTVKRFLQSNIVDDAMLNYLTTNAASTSPQEGSSVR